MMDSFLSGLSLIWDFLQDVLSRLFDIYTNEPILMSVLAIWLVRRLANTFKIW